ncbi:MAG: hypothetical protein LBQ75_05540 [Zoogloeaceae bacterium]|jgi:hypothetical protein|nr:hypothetical protein [Zoogloeaceae bacterium]
MKTVKGLQALMDVKQDLPDVGWILVDKDLNCESAEALLDATFYVEENDDGLNRSDHFLTWLESPDFADIFDMQMEQKSDSTVMDIARAILYYDEFDDFMGD